MSGELSKYVRLTNAVQQTKSSKSDKSQKGLLRTWWFYVIVAVLVYFIAFWLLKPIGDEDVAGIVESYQFIGLAAVSTLVYAIVAHKFNWLSTGTGQTMMTLSIGYALYTIAEASYLILMLSTPLVPVPSIADVFWVSAYLPFALALVLTIRAIRMKFTRLMLGLWIILSVVTFTVVLAVVVVPIVAAASGPDAVSTIFSMIYPFEDMVLIVLVLVILLKFRSGEVAKPWSVLILGFILTSVGDIWYGYAVSPLGTYSVGYDPVDLFLSLGYLATIAAGLLFTRLYSSK